MLSMVGYILLLVLRRIHSELGVCYVLLDLSRAGWLGCCFKAIQDLAGITLRESLLLYQIKTCLARG